MVHHGGDDTTGHQGGDRLEVRTRLGTISTPTHFPVTRPINGPEAKVASSTPGLLADHEVRPSGPQRPVHTVRGAMRQEVRHPVVPAAVIDPVLKLESDRLVGTRPYQVSPP